MIGMIVEKRLSHLFQSIRHQIIGLSDGTSQRRFAAGLTDELHTIRTELLSGEVLNVDETPLRSTQKPEMDEQGNSDS